MGIKQEVIAEVFRICKERGDFVFHNDLVKQVCKKLNFGNPFDATKIDNTSRFPQVLLEQDYFVLHIGNGKHQFVKGIAKGYHVFEPINQANTYAWKYRKSILNEFDTSESNILSVANNQRIIHDFLYEDIVAAPKVYNSRRTKMTFNYHIAGLQISVTNLQMEIDLTMELNHVVTVFEGKNGFPKDFAVYQLFHPFKYYSMLKKQKRLSLKDISCCYILRKKSAEKSVLRLYNYTFKNPNNMASIELLKSAQYHLIKR